MYTPASQSVKSLKSLPRWSATAMGVAALGGLAGGMWAVANATIAFGLLLWWLAGTVFWAIVLLRRSQRVSEPFDTDAFNAKQVLALSKAGSWQMQCNSNPDRMHLSPRGAEIAGFVPDPQDISFAGSAWRDAVNAAGDPASATLAQELLEQALGGEIERYDTVYALKRPSDGEIVWIHEIAERVSDPNSRQVILLAALMDVTDLKRTEKNTRTRPDLLANMGHEFRTPLNAILGLSHLVLKTPLLPDQRDSVKKIQRSGQHLLGLINDVIDFSRIESGKLVVEESDFRLSQVLDDMVHAMGERLQGKHIELIVNVNTSVPDRFRGDASRLAQILGHYVDNAIKFTHRGEVAIEVYPLEQTGDALLLRFDVRDTGIGLTSAQINGLFQGFGQADASTTRQHGGSGLGLTISKHVVGLLQGTVGVESEPGKGSNFWFTARLKKSHDQAPSVTNQPDLRGRRALVVDDNEHARLVMLDLLNEMTLMADAVDGADSAIAALKSEDEKNDPYEIVFLDWQMPGMDGIDLARWISAMALKRTPRIVMVTAHGREEILATARAAGIEDVLIKPVNPATLLGAALRAMRGETPAHAPESEVIQDIAAALQARSGARILVVEDNPVNQHVIEEILTDAGFKVELLDNGRKAVDRLAETPLAWDLVLMDMQMPVMDGVAATIEIRKKLSPAQLPIVAMTASAMRQDQDRCLQAGMQDFVTKPIDPEALERKLIQWVRFRVPEPEPTSELNVPRNIEGLDTHLGLQRVRGKQASYLRLLQRFAETEKWAHPKLLAAMEAGDLEAAELQAHSTKSSAGNIGATEIEALAETVEFAIRKRLLPSQINQAIAALESPLQKMVTTLTAHLQDGVIAASSDNAMLPLDIATTELLQLLDDDDALALDLFAQHASLFQAHYPAHFHDLEVAIKTYEFWDAAQQLADAVLTSSPQSR